MKEETWALLGLRKNESKAAFVDRRLHVWSFDERKQPNGEAFTDLYILLRFYLASELKEHSQFLDWRDATAQTLRGGFPREWGRSYINCFMTLVSRLFWFFHDQEGRLSIATIGPGALSVLEEGKNE